MAAMARLDGEAAALTPEQVDAHLAVCDACRDAVASLTTLQTQLDGVDYEHLDTDLWPEVQRRVAQGMSRPGVRESRAIIGLAIVLGAWRLAQLLAGLPAPVINSLVPLVLIVVVLRQVIGDPFGIRVTPHQLQQEGTS